MTTGEKPGTLAQGAFFTVLFVVIGLAGVYLPSLYFFAAMLLPLPVMLLVLNADMRCGIIGLTSAGLILINLIPPEAAFVLVFQYGLLGLLYGVLFKKRALSGNILSSGMGFAAFSTLLYMVLISLFTGNNLFSMGEEERLLLEQTMAAYRDAGMYGSIPAEMQGEISESMISTFELLIPGRFMLQAATYAAVTFFLARSCLQRFNYFLTPGLAFTRISLPWYSIWGPIAGLALTLAGDQFSWALGAKIGKNILFMLFWLYLITGLSVAAYFFRKVKVVWFIKVTFLVFAVLYIPFSMMILVLLGVADPLVNFRRLQSEK